MSKKDEDEKTFEPEIVEESRATLAKKEREQGGPLAKTLSSFSPMPFYNKIQERRIKGFRKVVQEETGLMDDLACHAKAKDRLKDIEVEIEKERIERRNKLQEAQREAMLSSQKDRIAKKKLDVEEEELDAKLRKLRNPEELKEETKIEKLKRELQEKLKINEVYREYEIEKLAQKFREELRTQQAINKVFNELEEEILQGRDPKELNEQEALRYNNLFDFYQKTLGKA